MVWVTAGAAAYPVPPGWVAVMAQVPMANRFTVFPETAQMDGVVEARLTGRPDEAVALTAMDVTPETWLGTAAKVMVCWAMVTAKVCADAGAAAYALFPAWVAVMPQVPMARRVTRFPETEQIVEVVEAKLTGRPDEAVALKLSGPALNGTEGRAAKVMV